MKTKLSVISLRITMLVFGIITLLPYSCDSQASSREESKKDDIVITYKPNGEIIIMDGLGRALKPQLLQSDTPPQNKLSQCGSVKDKSECMYCAVGNRVWYNPPGCGMELFNCSLVEVKPNCRVMHCAIGNRVWYNPPGCGQ